MRWANPGPLRLRRGMAASEHTVVLVHDYPERVLALDAASGSQRWERDGLGLEVNQISIASGYVAISAFPSEVLVIDERTGSLVWSNAQPYDSGSASICDSLVLARVPDGLIAYDAASGRMAWRAAAPYEPGRLAAAGPTVFFVRYAAAESSEDEVVALDTASGREQWRAASPDLYGGGLDAGAGIVAVSRVGPSTVEVLALDQSSGDRRWLAADSGGQIALGSLCVAGGCVVVASKGGFVPRHSDLIGFDAATGGQQWRLVPEGTISCDPVSAGDTVAFTIGDANRTTLLLVVDAATGVQRFALELSGQLSAVPEPVGSSIYLAVRGGVKASYFVSRYPS